jgi:hypothetical protein
MLETPLWDEFDQVRTAPADWTVWWRFVAKTRTPKMSRAFANEVWLTTSKTSACQDYWR